MTYPEFEAKWLGGKVDYDKVFQYQCVDLTKQYMAELFGMKPGAWGNAIDYWTKTNPGVLERFDKVSGSDVRQGDVVVLNGVGSNQYGHIGIATGWVDATNFEMLEQNGSTGNGSGTGKDAIRKRLIPRSRVAGLLRPKAPVVPPAPTPPPTPAPQPSDFEKRLAAVEIFMDKTFKWR